MPPAPHDKADEEELDLDRTGAPENQTRMTERHRLARSWRTLNAARGRTTVGCCPRAFEIQAALYAWPEELTWNLSLVKGRSRSLTACQSARSRAWHCTQSPLMQHSWF